MLTGQGQRFFGHVAIDTRGLDTGIGVSKLDQLCIFEPCAQAGRSATQKGTGLGLAITRRYVELLNGTNEVSERKARPKQVAGLAPPGQPEFRIPITEDERVSRLFLQAVLEAAWFSG